MIFSLTRATPLVGQYDELIELAQMTICQDHLIVFMEGRVFPHTCSGRFLLFNAFQ